VGRRVYRPRGRRGRADADTLAKWAAAVSDTLALGLINEGIDMGLPIVVLPHFNDARAAFGRRQARRRPV
jgi:hypothetical protein